MKYFATLFVLLCVTAPQLVAAQTFVPCGNPGQPQCTFCHFVQMGNTLIFWIIGFMLVAAGLIIAVAGIRLVTSGGNQSALDSAKELLSNALIGFVIILAGWLIVDTVMKVMLPNGATSFGPWNQISCDSFQQNATVDNSEGERRYIQDLAAGHAEVDYSGDTTPALTEANGFRAGLMSGEAYVHDEALEILQNAGISVWASGNRVQADCSGVSGCTSLQGVRTDTVAQVLNIKLACPQCDILITGATEGGHAGGVQSHANGYKIDLEDSPTLNNYLQEALVYVGVRGGQNGGPRYVDGCGNEYVKEGSHWDISITKGSCALMRVP